MSPKVASNKEIKKLEDISAIFFRKVLNQDQSFVTDESSLADFSPQNDIEKASGPGSKPGFYKFKAEFCYSDKNGAPVTKVSEWEEEGVDFNQAIIDKVLAVFGVDISAVVDEPLINIFKYIIENYQPKQSN